MTGLNTTLRVSISVVLAALLANHSTTASEQSTKELQDVHAAVDRALPVLQRSAAKFVEERSCFSCHHNALPILSFHLARARGFSIDAKTLSAIEEQTFRNLRGPEALDEAIEGVRLSDPTPNDSYLLMAAEAAGIEPDWTTGVYARRMARWQRGGHWVTSDFRPPHSSSLFSATATAVRAIRAYMPEALAAERESTIARARQWLRETSPQSTEDAAFRLMGLVWAGAAQPDVEAAKNALVSLQQSNGGWPQLPPYDSDAYSTGEALYALREAGTSSANPLWRKGLKFLVSTQARDGTWRVRTRMVSPAEVSPPYFSTGFPYGKDEFISYAGSAWAVMALLRAFPEPHEAPALTRRTPLETAPSWVATALFGTAPELERLLNYGVDPNAKTAHGTTMLMIAAPDAEKARILLSRGADAKVRTESGVDALTIASGYYGVAPSIQALLDAGAVAKPPEDVHVRREPLVLAAMTGDLESVRLLLRRGAEASVESLSEAVTFGYADVAQELIRAGAGTTATESTGVNLLHWATITGRASVIPVLVTAGVPLNAQDQWGFTPLMYAATLDNSAIDTLNELLKAGADRRLRNAQGRTALDEAKHFKRSAAINALQRR